MSGPIKTGFIFGAGASLSAGYPLAKDIPAAIKDFVGRIQQRPECGALHEWCDETLVLMQQERCATLDELAFALRERDRGQAVLRAKAVMTALFLDLEKAANLASYRRAVRAMVDFTDLGLPPDGAMDVPSSAFCMTYNYDRCLETAILKEVTESGRDRSKGYTASDIEVRLQRLINSGLDTMRERYEPIDTTRFALLKMHGIIGSLWDDHYPSGRPLCDFGKIAVDDSLLHAFERDHHRKSPTMIFFPWELSDAADWARKLIEETDRAAVELLSGVEELKIAGYSFHDFNRPRFERLIRSAKRCKVIDLYDISEESWLRLKSLKTRLGLAAELLWHKDGWSP
jgi:hypothetical protein